MYSESERYRDRVYPSKSVITEYTKKKYYYEDSVEAALDYLFLPRYEALNTRKNDLVAEVQCLPENQGKGASYLCKGNIRAMNISFLTNINYFADSTCLPYSLLDKAVALEKEIADFKSAISFLWIYLNNSGLDTEPVQLLAKQYPFIIDSTPYTDAYKGEKNTQRALDIIYLYLSYRLVQ